MRRRGTKAEGIAFLIIFTLVFTYFIVSWLFRQVISFIAFLNEILNSSISLLSLSWSNNLYFRIMVILLFFILIIIISIVLYVKFHIDSKNEFILKLKEINKNTYFHPMTSDIKHSEAVNSKRNLDNSDPKMVFYSILFDGSNPFSSHVVRANENEQNYLKYTNYYENVVSEARRANIPLKNFPFKAYYHNNLIKALNRQKIDRPVMNPRFIFELAYSSPTGKNKYNKTASYYKENLVSLAEKAIEDKKSQQLQTDLKMVERRKLNSSMRFKILKRDGYRCKICGFSAPDGANLHIDHKIPIAKGGLTVESNLWVVCAQCNLGKGTKKL